MMRKRVLLLVDVLLLIIAGWLGFHLYQAWTLKPQTASAPASVVAAPVAAPAPTIAPARPPAPPLSEYAGVVAERNLFSPSRSETPPEPPKTSTSAAQTPPAPKPRLYGIILPEGGKPRAYLEDVQKKTVFGYSIGDTVGGSRVEQIKADRVVLRRGEEVFEVLLRDPSKPKPPPPAPPQAGPGAPARPPGRAPVGGPSPTPGQSPGEPAAQAAPGVSPPPARPAPAAGARRPFRPPDAGSPDPARPEAPPPQPPQPNPGVNEE